jgi:hypothetical protein
MAQFSQEATGGQRPEKPVVVKLQQFINGRMALKQFGHPDMHQQRQLRARKQPATFFGDGADHDHIAEVMAGAQKNDSGDLRTTIGGIPG